MLNGEGTKVALYKVKAHVGIHGNEMADEVAKKACTEGEYGLNHDNTDTVRLLAVCHDTQRQLNGHQAIYNYVSNKVRATKMGGKTNVIQRMKRKLETGPEEWETKKRRIARTEAEYARRDRELDEPETGEETVEDPWPGDLEGQQMQEDEIEFQRMEQEEEAALMLAQHMQVTQQEEGGRESQPMSEEEPTQEEEWEVEEGEMRRIQEEEMTSEGQQEQSGTQNQQEPDQTGWATRVPSQDAEESRDDQLDTALQVTQEMELPETQDMGMEAQQDAEDELTAMAQQQEEAQEELRTIREMAQQQAIAQREAEIARGWRRASMEKIRIAMQETPEKYMQRLRGDTTMHKLSNEYWKKGTEYVNEHDGEEGLE
ncbi:hypothetical protein CYMTET_43134 [Cymbomonas tetramitiformis]|uniref:RNase H type-1 domain-containing protein n=1 Tax=Cymbomonas tetramitiformis TaxID=36881 RepID=A0AAE0C4V6_9CHLO|nr:hypothetical protein CYMTET_43134 [Cymbomonas tetramitiformis]